MRFIDRINITQKIGLLILVLSSLFNILCLCIIVSDDLNVFEETMYYEIEYSSPSNVKEALEFSRLESNSIKELFSSSEHLKILKINIDSRNIKISYVNSTKSMFKIEDLFDLTLEGAFSNKEEFLQFASIASYEDLYYVLQEGAFADVNEFKSLIFINKLFVEFGDEKVFGKYEDFAHLIKNDDSYIIDIHKYIGEKKLGSLEKFKNQIKKTKEAFEYVKRCYPDLNKAVKLNYDSKEYTRAKEGEMTILLIFISVPIFGLMLLLLFGKNKLNLFQKINLTLCAVLQPSLLIFITFLFNKEIVMIFILGFLTILFLLNTIIFKSKDVMLD